MRTDSCFAIGDGHQVCQDYALDGKLVDSEDKIFPNTPFAMVSDGCSGSIDTDVGARILLNSFSRSLMSLSGSAEVRLDHVMGRVEAISNLMGMKAQSLDATVVGLAANMDNPQILSFVSGDGYVARKTEDCVEIWEYKAGNGHPLYLSYRLDLPRLEAVRKTIGGKAYWVYNRFRRHPDTGVWQYGSDLKSKEDVDWDTDGERTFAEILAKGPFDSFVHRNLWTFDKLPEDGVWAVFSDGVDSFVDASGKPVTYASVIIDLLDFKTMKGEFVKRRMNGFLKKARKEGWRHHDDVAMAAISME